MAKYKKKTKRKQLKEQKLVEVGISMFCFISFAIISIGFVIYACCTDGFVKYGKATATIIELNDWNDSRQLNLTTRGVPSGHYYYYRFICEFVDDTGNARFGIYHDKTIFPYYKDVEYQEGLNYESGDKVTIYYPINFRDGDKVYDKNQQEVAWKVVLVCLILTFLCYWMWRDDKKEYDKL